MKRHLNHIVMFSFAGSAAEKRQIVEGFKADLEALPGVIDPLMSIRVELNINPDEDFDLMLHAVVEDMDALKAYSAHPAHVEAVAKIKSAITRRACIDYYDHE